ncbi:MAG: LysR family transcriptional regulator [Solirubrobacteraceae bacterium]|nr:LysR family transcriptional regulator [Solirubrobacteraceae bacterium]
MADPLAGVELRHLIALRAVARAGSFGGAADQLGYTQSAVSQQIAALEKAVGEKVIDRGNGRGRVTPTAVGGILLQHTDALMNTLDAARDDLSALRGGAIGTLRMGAYQSVTSTFLPAVIHTVRQQFPGLQLDIVEEMSDTDVEQHVLDGDLELGFTVVPVGNAGLAGIDLVADPWALLLSRECPPIAATDRASFDPADLDELPIVGAFNCRGFQHAISHLQGLGVRPYVAQHAHDNALIQGLAAAGVGAALLPRLAYTPDARLTVIPIDDLLPARRVGLSWRAGHELSAPARALVAAAQDVCEGLTPTWSEPALTAPR